MMCEMPDPTDSTAAITPPALLCFDGSDDAERAIAEAAKLLAPRRAFVLTAWQPVAVWEGSDPGALLSAGVAKLASHPLGLDEIAIETARDTCRRGVSLAEQAGFDAHGQLIQGKAWRAICDAADDLDAAPIVLGARGLSRLGSMFLGSVSAAVVAHATRPVLVVPREHVHV
jgi:nucleotide-binding universal stress UspA family protein